MSRPIPPAASRPDRKLRTRDGREYALPIFLPVYHRRSSLVRIEDWQSVFGVEGCIVNAYLLYKDRETRTLLEAGTGLSSYLLDGGFDGLTMTDSGAFQGFTGRLYLRNKKIVSFQDQIGADIISPLDLVTPPGDNRTRATHKLEVTQRRIREALSVTHRSVLAGVQQGGRFHDLRRRSLEELLELDLHYIALGSLVPFFNRNHDLSFVGRVIREARALVGAQMPIHVYGAGDPVELPFFAALGANVFDSASYGHYANGGWYMTPYGALNDVGRIASGEYACDCPFCSVTQTPGQLFADPASLAGHNLWTVLETLRCLRALPAEELPAYLEEVLERHQAWFPHSALARSWQALHE